MNHITMQGYSDEKISNARREADIQREVNMAYSDGSRAVTFSSLFSRLRNRLHSIARLRSKKADRPIRINKAQTRPDNLSV